MLDTEVLPVLRLYTRSMSPERTHDPIKALQNVSLIGRKSDCRQSDRP